MNYAYVQEGNVLRTGKIPLAWGNISGFDKATVEVQVAHGWYPLVVEPNPSLQLDQYLGTVEYDIQPLQVVASRPVITRTVDEVKVWMKERGKSSAKDLLQLEYDLQMQIVALSGALGAGYRDTVLDRINYYITAFVSFADEVDACTTKPELSVVYNKYSRFWS